MKMDDTPDNMMEENDDKKSQELSPTTKNRLANLFNRIPKFGKTRKDTDSEVSENKLDKVSNSAKNNQQISNSSPIRWAYQMKLSNWIIENASLFNILSMKIRYFQYYLLQKPTTNWNLWNTWTKIRGIQPLQ